MRLGLVTELQTRILIEKAGHAPVDRGETGACLIASRSSLGQGTYHDRVSELRNGAKNLALTGLERAATMRAPPAKPT